MNSNWFVAAALIVFGALALHGAPLVPVCAGVAGAAAIQIWRRRGSRR